MQTTLCGCNPNVASFQAVTNNQQADRAAQQRNGNFNNNSLTGDESSDQLLLGLILVLVQLLMQQFSGGNGGGNTGQEPATDQPAKGELAFTDHDKTLLLNAIGRDSNTTQIQRINDTDSSDHLNQGDNVDLLTRNAPEVHIITDEQSRSFIEARNPPGTPKLALTAAQTSSLAQRFNLEDVNVADINGDNRISEGDIVSGERDQGTRRIRVDVPVNAQVLGLLNG